MRNPMRRSSPRISVIIPVHNGGDEFCRCLEALAGSIRPPDELIIVDDASTDDSSGLARPYGAQIISLPDGPHGPARARNRGAAAARGEVLVFIDADHRYEAVQIRLDGAAVGPGGPGDLVWLSFAAISAIAAGVVWMGFRRFTDP